MRWKRFPLPLLLATVVLMPSVSSASRADGSTGPIQLESRCVQVIAEYAGSSESRRRRRGAPGDRHPASARSLAMVSDWLGARTGGDGHDPRLQLAWDRFYRWCDVAIRRYAAGQRLRGADVDDCAQQVWLDLLERLPDFRLDRSRGRFSSWLYRVVQSKSADIRRRQVRHRATPLAQSSAGELPDPMPDPCSMLQQQEARTAVISALSALQRQTSGQSYRVLHLRQVEGWTVAQVAQALHLTPAQVWARECRMKQKLAGLLVVCR